MNSTFVRKGLLAGAVLAAAAALLGIFTFARASAGTPFSYAVVADGGTVVPAASMGAILAGAPR